MVGRSFHRDFPDIQIVPHEAAETARGASDLDSYVSLIEPEKRNGFLQALQLDGAAVFVLSIRLTMAGATRPGLREHKVRLALTLFDCATGQMTSSSGTVVLEEQR